MDGLLDNLRELFADEPVVDAAGQLAPLSRLLEPWAVRLLFLADAQGQVIAAEGLAPKVDLEEAVPLAERVAAALRTEIWCLEPCKCSRSATLFGIRLEGTGGQGLLGGCLEGQRIHPDWLAQHEAALAGAGQLAWFALGARREADQAKTRVRHLQAQQSALKVAHTEAITNAIQEREERIRQQVSYDAQMNAVLRAAADGIIVTDESGVIETFNPAAERIFGRSAQEVLGRTLKPLINMEINEGANSLMGQLPGIGGDRSGFRWEVLGRRKDGTMCPLELSVSSTSVDGRRMYLVLARDMTDRKAAEHELRRLHMQNQMILNAVGEGIIGLDHDGVNVFVNLAAARMLGSTPAELLGQSHRTCLHLSHRDGTAFTEEDCPLLKTLHEGHSQHGEGDVFHRKDATTFRIEYNCTPILDDSRPAGAVFTFRDITQRQLLEAQLVQAQKLESIGQLAAGIAHEINTPTQYIGDNMRFLREAYGSLQGLLKEALALNAPAQDATGREAQFTGFLTRLAESDMDYYMDEIPKAIDQSLDGLESVSKIVRSMKEFSHPGAEEKQLVDLNRAIESTLTISRNEWKYFAEAVTELDPDLPAVPCLPGDLNQVLLNLIVNAAHAIEAGLSGQTDQKGRITVRTRLDGRFVEIQIEDTGTGIPKAIQDRIFDPFFTTKKVGRGTGQGLAIARAIVVDKHGGTIEFKTEMGQGTTFVIRIPVNPGTPEREGSHP